MGKKLKQLSFWVKRRSGIPLILLCTLIVLALYFNDEISIRLNMQYDRRIRELTEEIKENRDSAAYYHAKREAILSGTNELEHIAREQYHMQRPSEDVYIVK